MERVVKFNRPWGGFNAGEVARIRRGADELVRKGVADLVDPTPEPDRYSPKAPEPEPEPVRVPGFDGEITADELIYMDEDELKELAKTVKISHWHVMKRETLLARVAEELGVDLYATDNYNPPDSEPASD